MDWHNPLSEQGSIGKWFYQDGRRKVDEEDADEHLMATSNDEEE